MNEILDNDAGVGIDSDTSNPGWPVGSGEMAGRIRNHPWRDTPVGNPSSWPQHIRFAVQLLLDSPEPTCLFWTPEGFHLYNDAYRMILNQRHPEALGRTFSQVWPESAHLDEFRHGAVFRTGAPLLLKVRPYIVSDNGVARERFFTLTASPVRSASGAVEAVVQRLLDTTEQAEALQRLRSVSSKLGEHQAGLTVQLALSDAITDASARKRAEVRTELQDREERLRLALIAGRLATWDWDMETGKVVWSDQMYTIHGYAPDEIEPSFGVWAQRVHSEDLAGLLSELDLALIRKREFVHRFRIVHPDGSIHWCSARGRHFYDRPGRAVRMLAVAQDVTEEYRAQIRLRDIEAQQRALLEGVPQLIWRSNAGGDWTWCSPQWTRYTGQSLDQSLGNGWLDAVHPDDRERMRHAWSAADRIGVFDVECRIGRPATGRFRWFQTRATAIRRAEHGLTEWFGTSTDIEELRQARERQQLLVAELQHRTRNLLGVIRSVTALTCKDAGSLEEFQAQFYDRLEALSRAHGLLSRADGEPITLAALIRVEFEALGTGPIAQQLTLNGPQIRLQSSIVQAFALAIHELTTNALKHGVLLRPRGRVTVTWELLDQSSEEPRLRLNWYESGSESVVQTQQRKPGGYGRELLENMLPYVLDAKTTYEIAADGVRFTVEMPLRVDPLTGVAKITAAQ